MKMTSSVTLRGGRDLLLGAVTPRQAITGDPKSDRRVLFFVRGDIVCSPEPVKDAK